MHQENVNVDPRIMVEDLQQTKDENRRINLEYGKDSAKNIERKTEEIVATEIQTGTGKDDAGKTGNYLNQVWK
ncbi:hypothetical protein JTB14_030806 [Gonioctena quinquepunctata]|nr:hypothetical protein JTB14_030806 [Gonioctena quinquepunctata]